MTQKKEITGKPAVIKEVNIGLIKDALANLGQATRVELSKKTGISQPTVNMLMKELIRENVVLNLGVAQSTGGRRAEIYTLNLKREHIVSVIVKREAYEYCVFDLELSREKNGRIPRKEGSSCTEFLTELLERIFKETADIKAVTVGVPGAVSGEGEIFAIPQIPEWERFVLKGYLEEKYGVDVAVVNDINAVALGYLKAEKNVSAESGKDVKEMVYLHIDEEGMGAGIIIDGKLHGGCNSFAGEVGYMQVADDDVERTVLLSRVITNIICVLDPQEIVLEGRVTEALSVEIKKECHKHLPLKVMPEFTVISDSTEYYFMGLGTLGLQLLDHELRLR